MDYKKNFIAPKPNPDIHGFLKTIVREIQDPKILKTLSLLDEKKLMETVFMLNILSDWSRKMLAEATTYEGLWPVWVGETKLDDTEVVEEHLDGMQPVWPGITRLSEEDKK